MRILDPKKLRAARAAIKMSQIALARETDIPNFQISCIENQDSVFSLEKIGKIAEALNVSVEDITLEVN